MAIIYRKCNIYPMDKAEINKENVKKFFEDNHNDDLISVWDKDDYVGLISYWRVVRYKNIMDTIMPSFLHEDELEKSILIRCDWGDHCDIPIIDCKGKIVNIINYDENVKLSCPVTVAGKDSVLFGASEYSYLFNSFLPFIYYLKQKGINVVVMYPKEYQIREVGNFNYRNYKKIIKELYCDGITCVRRNELDFSKERFIASFFGFEYNNYRFSIEDSEKENMGKVIEMQVTPFPTCAYMGYYKEKPISLLDQKGILDYCIGSQYLNKWCKTHDMLKSSLFLPFGYIKQDSIYNKTKDAVDIPDSWYRKLKGKKVILISKIKLLTTIIPIINNEEVGVIFRPHPLDLKRYITEKQIRDIENSDNIVLDDAMTYMQAFEMSDAMICLELESMIINYMLYKKPIYIYMDDRIDYNIGGVTYDIADELWHSYCYSERKGDSITAFINDLKGGNLSVKKDEIRTQFEVGFDGEVSKRIYSYIFENY